jgi:hypothetical protein
MARFAGTIGSRRRVLSFAVIILSVLIDTYCATSDASESHRIEINRNADSVYHHLWSADLAGSIIVQTLMGLRALPGFLLHPTSILEGHYRRRKITLQGLIDAGFGKLAEIPGEEIVLGIAGRFWRPTGNVSPFDLAQFNGAVPAGMARAVWNFQVQPAGANRAVLTTETRIVCGDAASRGKFRAYWIVVRPFSGMIRQLMLRAVKRACESGV